MVNRKWLARSAVFGTLFIALLVLGNSKIDAQNAPPKKPNPKSANPTAQQAKKEQVHLSEAEMLREAHILLSSANHDYDGHRAKAMAHIQKAINQLDNQVKAKGTKQQKAITAAENKSEAQARIIAKHVPQVHEGQAQSDAQMKAGLTILQSVRGELSKRKQKKVLEVVEQAEKEISLALKIR